MACTGENDVKTEKSMSVQESLSEISESDVAKFPALFGVRQIIKSDPLEARSQLLEVRKQDQKLCRFDIE